MFGRRLSKMGTGSFGGIGSGGSGRSSRISGEWGLGYLFKNRKLIPADSSSSAARKEIRRILKKIPKNYIEKQFSSPLVLSMYDELFNFSKCMSSKDPCTVLAATYEISDGPGFLLRLVGILIHKYQQSEIDAKVRDLASLCLEDFLIKTLGDDLDLYLKGTCTQVIKKIDQKVFKSISGYFLGNMTRRVLQREYEIKQPDVEFQIQKESQILADKIINSFKKRFIEKGGVSYRDFFHFIKKNFNWFLGELRE